MLLKSMCVPVCRLSVNKILPNNLLVGAFPLTQGREGSILKNLGKGSNGYDILA